MTEKELSLLRDKESFGVVSRDLLVRKSRCVFLVGGGGGGGGERVYGVLENVCILGVV